MSPQQATRTNRSRRLRRRSAARQRPMRRTAPRTIGGEGPSRSRRTGTHASGRHRPRRRPSTRPTTRISPICTGERTARTLTRRAVTSGCRQSSASRPRQSRMWIRGACLRRPLPRLSPMSSRDRPRRDRHRRLPTSIRGAYRRPLSLTPSPIVTCDGDHRPSSPLSSSGRLRRSPTWTPDACRRRLSPRPSPISSGSRR